MVKACLTMASISYCFRFFPESARWLLSRGNIEKAKPLLEKAATCRKVTIPAALYDENDNIREKVMFETIKIWLTCILFEEDSILLVFIKSNLHVFKFKFA